MTITAFERKEIKFLLEKAQYQSILPALNQHLKLDQYCQNGREYSIHNIYYDTDDSRIIRQSIARPYYKEKLRLRSYGVPASPDSRVYLELKKKIGGIVNKRRAELSLEDAKRFLSSGVQPADAGYMTRQVLNEITFFLSGYSVQPAVYIGYQRTAWFGLKDPDFRVTFDHHIATRRHDLALDKGSWGQRLLDPGCCLMEVKINGTFPVWLARVLSQNRIYRTSFSKYGQEYARYMQMQHGSQSLRRAG